jgi:hypothetical protein
VRTIPPPAPTQPTAYSSSNETGLDVKVLGVIAAQTAVALGIKATQLGWEASRVKKDVLIGKDGMRARGDIGEGGMYI